MNCASISCVFRYFKNSNNFHLNSNYEVSKEDLFLVPKARRAGRNFRQNEEENEEEESTQNLFWLLFE